MKGEKDKVKAAPGAAEPAEQTETPLNPALREKYRVMNTHCPRVLNSPVGDIDFRTLTEEQAEQLVAAGFEFLERV